MAGQQPTGTIWLRGRWNHQRSPSESSTRSPRPRSRWGWCALCMCLLAPLAHCMPYTCDAVPQPPGGCDAACQKAVGTALLKLHAGLSGNRTHSMPWYHHKSNNMCTPHCHGVPVYCGWAGVLCCHNEPASTQTHTGECRQSYLEQVACPVHHTPGAVWRLDLTMQGLGGSLSDEVIDALKVLTRFGLQGVDFSSNRLQGTIPARLSELGANFTSLNLNFNNLTGTIPKSIAQLPNLQHLYLSFNRLWGSLQGRFCIEDNDPLEVLILRSNWFNGSVNLRACENMLLLDVTDNSLTGTLPVDIGNGRLISLRATNNRFSGPIPDTIWKLPLLTTIDLGNNDLTGTISEHIGTSNNLINIYLGNNSLSGTIPTNIVENSQMLALELHNNTALEGTWPTTNPVALIGLRRLDLHNTSIRGRIPQDWGQLPYLEYVDISGTRMTCCETQAEADNASFPKLPDFLMFSSRLSQFDLSRPYTATRTLDEQDQTGQPNHILCASVERRPQQVLEWNLQGLPITNSIVASQKWIVSPLYFWFEQCTCTKRYNQTGDRYRYRGIDSWCDGSSGATPLDPCPDMSIFECEPIDDLLKRHLPAGTKAAIAVGAFLVTLLVLGLLGYLMLAKASKFRRYLALSTIRLKGAPRSGRMTLVVTDIEGYSDIFRRAPEVMFRALVLHNSVLRAAKYHNGGFVMEQEGDSFTVAFYDPFDAVVFCLQAQQALLAVNWPPGLMEAQDPDASTHSTTSLRKGSKLHMRLSPLLGFGTRLKRTKTSARSMGSQLDHAPSIFQANGIFGGSKGQMDQAPVLFNGLRVRMGVVTGEVPSGTPIKNSALFQLAKVVGDFGNGGQIILDEATFAAIKDDSQALGAVDASGINHSKLASGRSGWNRLLRLCGIGRNQVSAEEVVLLDMGAFCQTPGDDDADLPYTTSRMLDVKQPAGPQQPPSPKQPWWRRCRSGCRRGDNAADTETDGDLSDGSPRHSQSALPPAAQMSRPYLGSRAVTDGSNISTIPSGFARPYSAASAGGASSVRSPSISSRQQQGQVGVDSGTAAGKQQDAAVVGRLVSFSARATKQWAELRKTLTRSQSFQGPQAAMRRDWESVRLYQVLPPALAGRAHVWHNKLNLKDGWICWDNMYFEAPGSTSAPLTGGNLEAVVSQNSCSHLLDSSTHPPVRHPASAPGNLPLDAAQHSSQQDNSVHSPPTGGDSGSSAGTQQREPSALHATFSSPCMFNPILQPLPPVTMVFMAVEGPEQLVRRRRTFTPVVQSLLSRVVRDALRRLGGYLCRVQEGDMKFMVAFASPVTALEWCLLVQTSAMYLPWPQSAIMLLSSCREQVDNTGRLVFRGPRIKMGVCEGIPQSILPDHEARADYHGASINMAARFMDKGARGGQIACTLELAQHVMAVWAAGGGSAAAVTSTYGPQGASQSIAEDEHPAAAGVAAAAAAVAGTSGNNGSSSSCPPSYAVTEFPSVGPLPHVGATATAATHSSGQRCSVELQPLNSSSADSSVRQLLWGGQLARTPPRQASVKRSTSPFAGVSFRRNFRTSDPSNNTSSSADAAAAGAAVADDARAPEAVPAEASFSDALPVLPGLASPESSCDDTAATSNNRVQTAASEPAARPLVQQQQRPPRLGRRSWGLHGRFSHDGATQQQRTASRLPALSQRPKSAHGFQGAAGGSSLMLAQQSQALPPPPPPVAPSPFAMQEVTCVPFRVEVQRLGLYSFKGGPPQQEMVQVVPSHLLGRAQFISVDTAQPASRKGQLLQRLEGRVGEPVVVQLPALAQDYHERLPHRVTGTTGLPHRCTSPTAAAAASGNSAGAGQQGDADVDMLRDRLRGSRSMTLPVRGGGWYAAGAAGGAASAAGPAASHGVRFGSASHTAAAAAAKSGAGSVSNSTAASDAHLSLHVSKEDSSAANAGSTPGGIKAAANKQLSGKHAAAGPSRGGAAAAAPPGPQSHIVDVQGAGDAVEQGSGLLRHDSFRSVDDVAAGGEGDEELGLSPAAAAAAAGVCGKSDGQLLLQPPGAASNSTRQSG